MMDPQRLVNHLLGPYLEKPEVKKIYDQAINDILTLGIAGDIKVTMGANGLEFEYKRPKL